MGFIPANDAICSFVEEIYGFRFHSAYIGQGKAKLGIREHENYNNSHSCPRKPCVCPEEKESAIKETLEHFGYICKQEDIWQQNQIEFGDWTF